MFKLTKMKKGKKVLQLLPLLFRNAPLQPASCHPTLVEPLGKLTTMDVRSSLSKRLMAWSSDLYIAAEIRWVMSLFRSMDRPSSCGSHKTDSKWWLRSGPWFEITLQRERTNLYPKCMSWPIYTKIGVRILIHSFQQSGKAHACKGICTRICFLHCSKTEGKGVILCMKWSFSR